MEDGMNGRGGSRVPAAAGRHTGLLGATRAQVSLHRATELLHQRSGAHLKGAFITLHGDVPHP